MAHTVQIGDETVRLEPFSGRKAIRVIRTVEHITKGVPAILDRWADFTRDYEARNITEMDRATARHYYRPDPLVEEIPWVEDGEPITDGAGGVLMRRRPLVDDKGIPVMGPDPLGHMTDEDWAASGNKLRLPRSPRMEEQVAAVFPMALELAEHEVTQLLALLAMSNGDLKRHARAGTLTEELETRADDLLDAPATDLIELAVTAGEMVDDQFTSKIRELGSRLPNALRLLGVSPRSLEKAKKEATTTETTTETSSESSSETKATSSTSSPSPTDGTSAPSSTKRRGRSSEPSPVA